MMMIPMKMASASKIKTLQQISSVLLGNVFQREGLMTHCHCYSEQQNNCLKSANIGQHWQSSIADVKTEAAAQAALNAYLGNWAFGVPDNKVIHLLSQAADVPNFRDDPVIQCIKEQGLDLSFGGTKENNNYPLMQMCVDTYFAQRKPLQALTLLHNYAR